ncbi:MAG: hypothetical protein U1U88_000844 [Lawsonella clevelandensis]
MFGPFILSCALALSSVWTLLSLLALPLAWNAYTPAPYWTGGAGPGGVVEANSAKPCGLVSSCWAWGLALGPSVWVWQLVKVGGRQFP